MRRTFSGAMKGFVTALTVEPTRYGTRLSSVIDSNECKDCACHLLPDMRPEPASPSFDCDGHRCSTNMIDRCVDAEDISYFDRSNEVHSIHCTRDHTPHRSLGAGDPTSEIHLRHHPSTKDVAARIGVRRHRNGAQSELAAWIWIFIHYLSKPWKRQSPMKYTTYPYEGQNRWRDG